MADTYIIIPESFALQMEGKVVENIEFNARQTTNGKWVCAEQSATDFAEDFATLGELVKVDLTIEDFPTIEINL